MCSSGRKTYQPPLPHRLFLLHVLCLFNAPIIGDAFLTHGGRLSSVSGVLRQKTAPTSLRSIEGNEDVTVVGEKAASGFISDLAAGFDVSETQDQINCRHRLQIRRKSTVFIEMTDMYGIVYHANYITYVLRAMERTFGVDTPAPYIHALHDMKYRAAATLGETVIVSGDLVSCDMAGGRSRWLFQVTATDPSRVFVSAEATISWPGVGALPVGVAQPPANPATPNEQQAEHTALLQRLPAAFGDLPKRLDVIVWNGDLDAHSGELTITAVLNYFERIRTLSLGRDPDSGELGLVRLHREGVSVVVTNIADLRIDSRKVRRGDTLQVRLGAKLTRGNRVMTMYETLCTQDGALIAHAEIALFCMDNETRKFRSVPQWVQDIVTVPSAAAADA